MIPLPPPPPHEMPAGTRLVAGFGHATVLPDLDFETYSEAGYEFTDKGRRTGAGLKDVGAAVYSEHPSTEVLSAFYDLKAGAGPQFWKPGMPLPEDLFDHMRRGGLLEAWNMAFERLIWTNVCAVKYGWPDPRQFLPQFRCAMGKARAFSLPGKLGEAAAVVGASVQKDKAGTSLLDLFSKPRTPTVKDTRRRIRPEDPDQAENAAALYSYNRDDIRAEAGVSALCPDLEGDELTFWLSDQAINARGVHIDRAGVRNCIAIIEQAHDRYNRELFRITGGAVQRASELAKLRAWLDGRGVILPSMDEDAIADALARTDLSPEARRALEIRQAIGSASVKKVYSMEAHACKDDRMRDLFTYYGARTGRPTGNGPQPTNLPKAGPKVFACGCGRHSADPDRCRWCGVARVPMPPGVKRKAVDWNVKAAEDALQIIATRSLDAVEYYFRDAMLAVSGCLRSLFIAAPGHDLISSDFTAIEAVVLAAMAGERWRLDVFNTPGSDIYLESISRSTGTPLEELYGYKPRYGMHHPYRQSGKVTELALGYGGWINAMKVMYGQLGIELTKTDDQLKQDIIQWRDASPAIVEWWGGQSRNFGRVHEFFGLEGAAVQAVLMPGTEFRVNRLDGSYSGVAYQMRGDCLYCLLPSGRRLAYHRPRVVDSGNWRGWELSYEGYNSNPANGRIGWVRMQTYAGKLAENVVQAVARDIQRSAINNLEAGEYPVVLHVYDEDVCEVREGFGSVEELESIMTTLPDWASFDGKPWPIKAAGGWRHKRYQKA